ncbi:hypothetical protein BJV78DRAFT_1244684 [Lactifluus subvellereus]|nr:hypothetical protein BJV78DRAFT_1244684 [Lactifluus subvellereus]
MATGSNQASKPPQDIVAIFHASFHPTRGNNLDWSLRASDDIQLDGVEFSALPSGLHLVEQDVVYFSSETHRGVCIFRRRQTSERGQRGFRLSSLGILLAPSLRPRPWRHVSALRALAHEIYSSLDEHPRGSGGEPEGDDWAPARRFFDERRVRRTDLGGAGEWHQWSEELDENHDYPDGDTSANPTLQLPHFLRILGPSSLTLYKHILGRRRILIYTQPPVEAACIFCQVAADMCFEEQTAVESVEGIFPRPRQRGKQKEGINVLGAITLHDISVLEHESNTGCGWIACTTDAVFMEKPQYYDLIIDMTSFSPERASRPGLQLSVREPNGRSRKPSYHLSTIRFTWSDVKLWNELDRILQLDAGVSALTRAPPSLWTDTWRLYEDMCLACAGLWTGGRTWRSSNNGLPEAEEQAYVDGPDADASVRVRARGEGIEGRPIAVSERSYRHASRSYAPRMSPSTQQDGLKDDDDEEQEERGKDAALVCNRQRKTTLALLQTLHAQTRFWLSRLATLLPDPDEGETVVQLTPRDVLELELSPLSSLDARFVEWLAEEYGAGARVSVRRGWRDLFGLVFALGGGPS